MNLLFIDTETFLDKKDGYDLRKMSIVEYWRDPRSKMHGIGIAGETLAPVWLPNEPKHIDYLRQRIDKDTILVGHNLKFDAFGLWNNFGIRPGGFIDTKALSKAVLGKTVKGHSLALLAEHFGLPAKGEMKTDGIRDLTPEQEKELADYCLHDVWLCREIYKRLIVDFPKNQLPFIDWTVRTFVDPKLELDVPLLLEANEREKVEKQAKIDALGIPRADFASNQKFMKVLSSRGYRVPFKNSPRTGKPIPALSLGDPAFLQMLEEGDEQLRLLCEARKAIKSTLMETRSKKLADIGKTGKWPFDIEFSGAEQTHRFSGSGGAGGNPQNFTRGSALRAAVRAPEGYSLVIADFSNIELRLAAYISQDPGLIQAIEQGRDLYCDFASAFFGRRITKEDKAERQFGKCAILGLGYGMGAKKFRVTARLQTKKDISDEDAKKAVALYRGLYQGVPRAWEAFDRMIPAIKEGRAVPGWPVRVEKEKLVLPSGLAIRYWQLRKPDDSDDWIYSTFERKNPEIKKIYGGKILENICQALAGELTKESSRPFLNELVGLVHDEIILCVKDEDAEARAAELRKMMCRPPLWLSRIKLDAEVKIGKTWGIK